MAHIWVGLSGWSYANWRGALYPPALPSREYLAFYAQEFGTSNPRYSPCSPFLILTNLVGGA